MSDIDVSFITINYNSSDFTASLVESVFENTQGVSYEVIVVDNASERDDFQKLEDALLGFDKVKIVRSDINVGFASGNMLGVSSASGSYYFFINNDCTVLNDAASYLKSILESSMNVVLATGAIQDKSGKVSSSHKQFPHLIKQVFGNGAQRYLSRRKFPSNKERLQQPTKVEVVSGACMFFDARFFCQIGGFDTMFFLYCEEEDISKRVWDAGGEVFFVPEAKVFHSSGGSSSSGFVMEREWYISYFHLLEKHYGMMSRAVLKSALFLKLLIRVFKKKNGLSMFAAMLRGFPVRDSLRYQQRVKKL